jgi:hypothetical protein
MMSSSTSTDTGTTGTATTTTTTIPPLQSALFVGTSREVGRYFHVQSLPGRHHEKLGLKLINCDGTGGTGSSGSGGGAVLDPTAAVMEYQFYPGYALVGGYTDDNNDGPYRNVIRPGDMIIAVNGRGFRRFAYQDGDEDEIEMEIEVNNNNNTTEIGIPPTTTTTMTSAPIPVELDHAVVLPGTMAYRQLLEKIKAVQLASGDPPLTLTLIRYDWDARPFAWRRFLLAAEAVSSSSTLSSLSTSLSTTTSSTTPKKKNNNVVPEALRRHQNHLQWRNETFPIDISSPGVQAIFSTRTIASIHRTNTDDKNDDEHDDGTDTSAATDTAAAGDHHHHNNNNNHNHNVGVPVVYVNYGRLLRLLEPTGTITATDVRHALLVVTEQMLAASCNGGGGGDPRFPSVTLLIDVSSVSSSSQSSDSGGGAGGSVTALSTLFHPTVLRVDLWRDLYRTFEPNYPETLHQLIVYPVNAVLVR